MRHNAAQSVLLKSGLGVAAVAVPSLLVLQRGMSSSKLFIGGMYATQSERSVVLIGFWAKTLINKGFGREFSPLGFGLLSSAFPQRDVRDLFRTVSDFIGFFFYLCDLNDVSNVEVESRDACFM